MTDEQLPLAGVDSQPNALAKPVQRSNGTVARTKSRRTVREDARTYQSVSTFLDATDQSVPRPAEDSGSRQAKKNYAEKLSNKLAVLLANWFIGSTSDERLRMCERFPSPSKVGRIGLGVRGLGGLPEHWR